MNFWFIFHKLLFIYLEESDRKRYTHKHTQSGRDKDSEKSPVPLIHSPNACTNLGLEEAEDKLQDPCPGLPHR